MIDTVLFDIGGTLLTAKNSPQRAVRHAQYLLNRLEEHGIVLDVTAEKLATDLHENSEEYKHWGERNRRELPNVKIWNEFYLKEYNLGEEVLAPIAEELSFCHDYIRINNQQRPGLKQMLQELTDMGMKIGVISNIISRTFVPHILREYGVEHYFQDIVTSCESGIRKPDPKIFQYAMDRIGSTKETTCYVGDTISRDVLGSRNAELAMIIKINNPSVAHRDVAFQGPDAPKPDYTIDGLEEIPGIISNFNKNNTGR